MKSPGIYVVAVLALLAVVWSSLFTIDETEVAIVTEFGAYKRSITEPGLNFKLPFVQVVDKMERRILGTDSPPSNYLTRDKKRLVVDPITRWRVDDPFLFYTSVRDLLGAKARLDDITNSELRRELASRTFSEIVCVPTDPAALQAPPGQPGDGTPGGAPPAAAPPASAAPAQVGSAAPAPAAAGSAEAPAEAEGAVAEAPPTVLEAPAREVTTESDDQTSIKCGRDQVMAIVTKYVQEQAAKFGIMVIDVRMKRTDLPPEVQESVYQRMKAERARVATGYRSKGEEEAQKIRADTDKQRRLILAEAYETAETLRGEGDAESIRTYADAYGKDTEFYSFVRSLGAYEKSIDPKTTIVLSTRSPLFRYLEGPSGVP